MFTNASLLTLQCWLRLERKQLFCGFALISTLLNCELFLCNVVEVPYTLLCNLLWTGPHLHFNASPLYWPLAQECNYTVPYFTLHWPSTDLTIVHWSPSIGVGHCTIGCNGCNIAMQYNGWTADTLQHKQNHNNDSCYKYYMEIIVSVDKFATLYISKCKSDWT